MINEQWMPLKGHEETHLISNFGRVKALRKEVKTKKGVFVATNEKIMSLKIHPSQGYVYIGIRVKPTRKYYKVHRLVAHAFIPNPNNYPIVNHKDGNKQNNHVSNLEWCTHKMNTHHAMKTGLMDNGGSRNGMSRLTDKQVRIIRSCKGNVKNRELAEIFGVHLRTIAGIQSFEKYKSA